MYKLFKFVLIILLISSISFINSIGETRDQPKSKEKPETEIKREEAIKKLGEYKGVLDKPGADKENIRWENAVKKETDHFIIRTNLSIDALNDICIVIEYAYFAWQDFFGFPEPEEKCNVSVVRNKAEFDKLFIDLMGINTTPTSFGIFIPKNDSRNKSLKNQLLTYYSIDKITGTTQSSLLHQSAYYVSVLLVYKSGLDAYSPLWFCEGIASYFESSKIEDNKLVLNIINPDMLSAIQQAIKENTYIKLRDFINLPSSEYSYICYSAGWSFVYFLVNNKNGKYKDKLKEYIEALGKDKMWSQNKDIHIKLFEGVMAVPIDELEKEWRNYILCLELKGGTKRLNELKPQYEGFIKTHQYSKAITLCESAVEELRATSSEEIKKELKIWLDEATRQGYLFSKMVKGLSSGPQKKEMDIGGTKVIINKANETEVESQLKGILQARPIKQRWAELPAKSIYPLFEIGRLKDEEKFNLAIWSFNHELISEAENVLCLFYKEQSSKIGMINELLARKRKIPIPEEGFIIYKDQWITAQEKKEKLEAETKREEAIKKLSVYKGVLDKPGADNEKLPWEKAWEKETDHFIVKTNLSMDALNDICIVMECAYLSWQDFFGFSDIEKKLRVSVMKNRDEFTKVANDIINVKPLPGQDAIFISKESLDNKSHEDQLVTYYRVEQTMVSLLHEGTHYAVVLVIRTCETQESPQFMNEGLSSYFESSKLEGKKLVINLLNRFLLLKIKSSIQNNSYIKLKDFINIEWSKYAGDVCYSEGWGLIYFLVNGKDGKYKNGFLAYLEAWKTGKIVMKLRPDGKGGDIQNPDAHIKLFEEVMSTPIDQLEKEWKEYILSLK